MGQSSTESRKLKLHTHINLVLLGPDEHCYMLHGHMVVADGPAYSCSHAVSFSQTCSSQSKCAYAASCL